MKKNLSVFIATITFLLISQISNAQRFVRVGDENAGASRSFTAKSISKDSMIVFDSESEIAKSGVKYPLYSTLVFKRIPSFQNIFSATFGRFRLDDLLPERSVTFNFYVNPDGEILETAILLRKDTRLTSFEVEKLQQEMVIARFGGLNASKVKKSDVYIIQRVVTYRRVIGRVADSFL